VGAGHAGEIADIARPAAANPPGTDNKTMNLLLNIIWLIFGGFLVVLAYLMGAILLCITIIGIPFGIQCFKLAELAVAPFGREIREKEPPSGALAVIMNIIWIILPGLELAVFHLVMALAFAITIIGLPLAAQHLKMTRLALIPFGFEARDMA
jgi:uncharacterized membrane protein YccF (DUF307 family)